MSDQEKQRQVIVSTEPPETLIVYQPRRLSVYQVTEQEIDSLSEVGSAVSTYQTFMAACFSASLALFITIQTVPLVETKLAVFTAVSIATLILGVFLQSSGGRA